MEVARGLAGQAAPPPAVAPPPGAALPPPVAAPPGPVGTAQATGRPLRVQSVLRGPTEASCLQQAVADGQQASANGYAPVWQTWGRDAQGVTLTILYDLVQPAAIAPAWAAPPAPQAAAPVYQAAAPVYQPPPPQPAAPAAPTYQPAPPPVAVPPPPATAAPPAAGPTPGSVASALGSRVIRFVAVFAVAFIVWFLYYNLERSL